MLGESLRGCNLFPVKGMSLCVLCHGIHGASGDEDGEVKDVLCTHMMGFWRGHGFSLDNGMAFIGDEMDYTIHTYKLTNL